jgi:hypothetical protein
MCGKFPALFALLLLVPLAFAQQIHPQPAAGSPQVSGNCAFTFSSGTGHGATQYCVTAAGNIAQFAMTGLNGIPSEMFSGVAPASEGYGVCDTSTLKSYYDYNRADSGNWNPPTSVSTPKSVTITRTTADGIWKIV